MVTDAGGRVDAGPAGAAPAAQAATDAFARSIAPRAGACSRLRRERRPRARASDGTDVAIVAGHGALAAGGRSAGVGRQGLGDMFEQQRMAAAAAGVTAGGMSDASRLEFDVAGEGPRGPSTALSPVVQEIPGELLRRFFAAALGFHRARPWEVFVPGDVVDLEVPALAIADGGAMVVRKAGRCRLELFVDRASAPVGARALTVPHGLEVRFHGWHELPFRLCEELLRSTQTPASGPVPELRVVDGAGELRPLEPRDLSIAIAGLESLRLFVVDHADRLRSGEVRGIAGRYFVDVGQGSVEIAVRLAAERTLELVLDGAA